MKLISIITSVILLLGSALSVQAQSAYKVRSGDTLIIEVLEDPSLNRSTTVLPDGRFSFPFAGTLRASGQTVGQIENTITSSISSNFAAEPNVFVSVQPFVRERVASAPVAAATISIYLVGEIASPGLKEVPPGTTFLQAMSYSGGLSNFAATKRLQLRRTAANGQQTRITVNFKAFTRGDAIANDFPLSDGDVILVPERRLFE